MQKIFTPTYSVTVSASRIFIQQSNPRWGTTGYPVQFSDGEPVNVGADCAASAWAIVRMMETIKKVSD